MQSLILQEIEAVRMDLLANQIRKRTQNQKKSLRFSLLMVHAYIFNSFS